MVQSESITHTILFKKSLLKAMANEDWSTVPPKACSSSYWLLAKAQIQKDHSKACRLLHVASSSIRSKVQNDTAELHRITTQMSIPLKFSKWAPYTLANRLERKAFTMRMATAWKLAHNRNAWRLMHSDSAKRCKLEIRLQNSCVCISPKTKNIQSQNALFLVNKNGN